MTRLVPPQTLRGFRDVLPEEMILRNEVIGKIRRVYESYGYLPIDTPVLELLTTLVGMGGDDTDKQIFQLTSPEDQQVGMRFDLTVPFARIVAQYGRNELRLPFRRYHIGPVFRADDPQPEQGRFRQFTQFDIDIAGTDSVAADAEIVAVMSAAFQALGLTAEVADGSDRRYFIRLSSRKLVDAFLLGLGIDQPDQARHVMRVIDKRDKLSRAELVDELGGGRVDRSGDPIRGVGLDAGQISSILDFVATTGLSRRDVLSSLEKSIRASDLRDQAISTTALLGEHLEALGVSEAAAVLDPSLTRGLEYYTGTVFEGALPHGGVGSIMGGGRYDGLVNRFLVESIPATGASIGLDRLITGLRNVGLNSVAGTVGAGVLVLVMPGVRESEASRVAAELRAGGLAAELYVGDAVGRMGRQLAYANARGMAVAVIVGEDELQNGTVTVKDLATGGQARSDIVSNEEYRLAGASAGQQTVPRPELASAVRALLARN